MYLDISIMLTSQSTRIICHHMKSLLKRERKKQENIGAKPNPCTKIQCKLPTKELNNSKHWKLKPIKREIKNNL